MNWWVLVIFRRIVDSFSVNLVVTVLLSLKLRLVHISVWLVSTVCGGNEVTRLVSRAVVVSVRLGVII